MPKIIITETLGPNVVAGASHNWNWNTIRNICQTYGKEDWFVAAQPETLRGYQMTDPASPTKRKLKQA